MMPVVFSPQAEMDVEDIADFIAADNPSHATRFVQELRAHCDRIGLMPTAYRARPELGATLRSCSHGRYVIFFTHTDTQLRIERVLHGARDIGALFDS